MPKALDPDSECGFCGHCGCNALAGGPAKWYPGIGAAIDRMRYYENNPQIQPILFQLIKDEFAVQYGRPWEHTDIEFSLVDFTIKGGGPQIKVDLYVSRRGIHVSVTNFSCPWFQLGTPNACRLWGRNQLPPSCKNYPQMFHLMPGGDALIGAWELNHPDCGYSWIDV